MLEIQLKDIKTYFSFLKSFRKIMKIFQSVYQNIINWYCISKDRIIFTTYLFCCFDKALKKYYIYKLTFKSSSISERRSHSLSLIVKRQRDGSILLNVLRA